MSPAGRRVDGQSPRVEWVESTDGVQLPLYDFGGEGPALLVAHATGFHALVYEPLIEALAGLRVYALDFRAHGDARTPARTALQWSGFTDDAVAVAELLRSRHPVLFGLGHSMGGAALLRAQQRRPGSFSAIYAFEPVILPAERPPEPSPRSHSMVETARRRKSRFASVDDAIANYRSKPPYDTFDERALRLYVEHGFAVRENGSVELKCRPEDESEIYAMSGDIGPFRRLAAVEVPVVVARGANLMPGPGQWTRSIAEQLPNGREVVLDGVGHLGPMEDPGAVAKSVLGALLG